jgi:hypothetical protein
MDQLSFASLDYAAKKKRTKRDVFLAEMAAALPRVALESLTVGAFQRTALRAAVCTRGVFNFGHSRAMIAKANNRGAARVNVASPALLVDIFAYANDGAISPAGWRSNPSAPPLEASAGCDSKKLSANACSEV